jgi:hypothetical protein
MAWQHILPELTEKGFKKGWICSAVDETDGDVDGHVRSECQENEGTDCETVNMKIVAPIGNGRQNLTRFLY